MQSQGNIEIAGKGRAYAVLFLLFLFQMLNFFDKLVLGLSAVPIMHDLALTPQRFGLIGSSFFLLFSLSGILVGLFVIGRVPIKWVIATLALIWSISQISIFFTNSFVVLIVCRILLGLGEGPGLPSALHACYDWFDSSRRSVPSAVVLQGISFGLLVGSPLLTAIILHRGWHMAFLACGGMSLLWAILWMIIGKQGPLASLNESRNIDMQALSRRVKESSLWLHPTVIGVMLMSTMSYWIVGMAGTWLPPYLRLGLGYPAARTGWIISAIYLFQSPLLLGGAWLTQRLMRKGWSRRACLGNASGFALLGSAVALLVSTRMHGLLQLCLIAIAFTAPSLTTIFGPVALGEIAPPAQRGRLIIVIYSANTVSALVSNAVVGWLVGRTPHMAAGFTQSMELTAGVLLLGAVSAFLLMFTRRSNAFAQQWVGTPDVQSSAA